MSDSGFLVFVWGPPLAVLRALCSGITSSGLRGSEQMPGMEAGLAACKASVLPDVLWARLRLRLFFHLKSLDAAA